MSAITTLNDGITGASFRSQVNTNFSNLNTDKAELSGATFTGDISVPDEAYGAGWNGSLEVPTKNAIYDKIETMGGGGATTFTGLTDTPSSYTGQALKVVQVNSGETALQFVPLSGGGDALTANPLSQFASTTSAQLAGVISDETGSGVLVFGTDPTFTTRINVPEIKATSSSGVDVHNNSGTQVALFGAGGSTGSTLVGTTNVGSASADYHQLSGGTGTITDTATGSSSNININVVPKGTGRFQAGGVNVPTVSSTDTMTNKTMTGATNTLTASVLKSATTEVNVSSATAPTSGQVLTATGSTTATWQTPSGGGIGTTGFRAIDSSGTAIGLSLGVISFETEDFDDGGNYNNATYRYTAPSTGKYMFGYALLINSVTVGDFLSIFTTKNGSTTVIYDYVYSAYNSYSVVNSSFFSLNSGDYIDLQIQNQTAARGNVGGSSVFWGYKLP